jgi:hypothetical protein
MLSGIRTHEARSPLQISAGQEEGPQAGRHLKLVQRSTGTLKHRKCKIKQYIYLEQWSHTQK